MLNILRFANLSLLVLFPVAWFAPILKSGLIPFLGLDENSIMTALQQVWAHDMFLALMMTFFAIFAPYIKIVGLALIQFNLASPRLLDAVTFIGKLAMADVFLISIFIVIFTGIEVAGVKGTIETSWGLYLFSACVIASLLISILTRRYVR
jgi:paraquat-inducible protein A